MDKTSLANACVSIEIAGKSTIILHINPHTTTTHTHTHTCASILSIQHTPPSFRPFVQCSSSSATRAAHSSRHDPTSTPTTTTKREQTKKPEQNDCTRRMLRSALRPPDRASGAYESNEITAGLNEAKETECKQAKPISTQSTYV